jgi:hypothetical protein
MNQMSGQIKQAPGGHPDPAIAGHVDMAATFDITPALMLASDCSVLIFSSAQFQNDPILHGAV